MGIQCFGWAIPIGIPNSFHDVVTTVHDSWAGRKIHQQVELFRREIYLNLVKQDTTSGNINVESTNRHVLMNGFVCGAMSSSDRTNTSDQFSKPKWFCNVIIGADFQTKHTVYFFASCGEHNDWHLAVLSNAPAHFKTVEIRQAYIQENHVWDFCGHCVGTVGNSTNAHACRC